MKRIPVICAALLFCGSLLFAGGSGEAKKAPAAGQTAAPAGNAAAAGEAPMLKALVDKGQLPALDQRTPAKEDRLVIHTRDSVGTYGGKMYKVWKGPSDTWGIDKLDRNPMVFFDGDNASKIVPNVVKGWDVSADGKTWTFFLRKGMKWSDGTPYTTEDYLFNYTYIWPREKTFGWTPEKSVFQDPKTGEWAKFKAVDDTTYTITFPSAPVDFLMRYARVLDYGSPDEYWKTKIPPFISEEKSLEIAKSMGYSSINQMFSTLITPTGLITRGYPSLRAWIIKNDPSSQEMLMERNPYYWKFDEAGNQYPYIDTLAFTLTSDTEVIKAKANAGDLDFQYRHIQTQDMAMLKEGSKTKGYDVYIWSSPSAEACLFPNYNTKKPNLSALFNDKRFRQALSYSLNRKEVIDLLAYGMATPSQASNGPGTPHYDKEWAGKYVEYAPDKANAILDEMGLKWDAKKEYRTFPDGSRVSWTIAFAADKDQFVELVSRQLKVVGFEAIAKPYERSLFEQKNQSGDLDMVKWGWADRFDFILGPEIFLPISAWSFMWPQNTAYYLTNGKEGTAPTGDVQKMMDAYNKYMVSPKDSEKYVWEIMNLHKENIFAIGTYTAAPKPIVVSKKLRNVPKEMVLADSLGDISAARLFQFYFAK